MGSTRKVLLVDDDADQLLLFSALLAHEQYEVFVAHSGREALEILSNQPVDVVVADVAMPEMSGLDLAEKIRSDSLRGRVPIVLMTAGREAVDFSSSPFRADMFCLKQNLKKTFIPGLNDLLRDQINH